MQRRGENRFITTQPWDSKTGRGVCVGPSPVIFLISSKQTAVLAPGHREMEVTLEVTEDHWVRADRKDGGNPLWLQSRKDSRRNC